jgi:transcriptional regulator with XRE-family HTH domain
LDVKDIGQRIREARIQAGMSQTELANAMGYSGANSISKLESGKVTSVDVMLLLQIARHTGVDISFLVMGHGALLKELRAMRHQIELRRRELEKMSNKIDRIIKRYDGNSMQQLGSDGDLSTDGRL